MGLESIAQLLLVTVCMLLLAACGEWSAPSYSLRTTALEEFSTATHRLLPTAAPYAAPTATPAPSIFLARVERTLRGLIPEHGACISRAKMAFSDDGPVRESVAG